MRRPPLNFFTECVPPRATSQSAGKRLVMVGGKPRFFKSASAKKAEAEFHALFGPHAPSEPFMGPLGLNVVIRFPWLKSHPKSTTQHYSWIYHDKRPDADNLVKMIKDALTELQFYGDDGQVAKLSVEKQYGDTPGVNIELFELCDE